VKIPEAHKHLAESTLLKALHSLTVKATFLQHMSQHGDYCFQEK